MEVVTVLTSVVFWSLQGKMENVGRIKGEYQAF